MKRVAFLIVVILFYNISCCFANNNFNAVSHADKNIYSKILNIIDDFIIYKYFDFDQEYAVDYPEVTAHIVWRGDINSDGVEDYIISSEESHSGIEHIAFVSSVADDYFVFILGPAWEVKVYSKNSKNIFCFSSGPFIEEGIISSACFCYYFDSESFIGGGVVVPNSNFTMDKNCPLNF